MKNCKMVLGLCQGRHDIPVEGYIFPKEVNPLDLKGMEKQCHAILEFCTELDLYVTGLSVALVTVINYCCTNRIPLTLYHYDRESGEYYKQAVNTCQDMDLLIEAGYYRK